MGGKGKKGGYPWWEHIKSKGGASGGGGSGSNDSNESAHGNATKQAKLTKPETELEKYVWDLEGSQYHSYKQLQGEWAETSSSSKGFNYTIFLDHIQGDAYAPPSHVRLRLPFNSFSSNPSQQTLLSSWASDSTKTRAVCDFIQRVLSDLLMGGSGVDWTKSAPKSAGWSSSKGGDIQIAVPSQYVLKRSGVILSAKSASFDSNFVECRVTVGLPAHGRTIEGRKCAGIFSALVESGRKAVGACFSGQKISEALDRHIKCVEDQVWLRGQLSSRGLVAFVANGSILPRLSGADDRPMSSTSGVVPFKAPEANTNLEVTFTLPSDSKTIIGLGIKQGVTLIVGGGYHGKSTLLSALQSGVYDTIPGDGRELVVTDSTAFKVRSEDGRVVSNTDISPFLKNLPGSTKEKTTVNFSTKDASGSTSQAANLSEALEAGAKVLLLDEDTCATNFMVRDQKMQQLVAKNKEPIQPFVDSIRKLLNTDKESNNNSQPISTILVVGASGEFFRVADTVLLMEDYKPQDVTEEAKRIYYNSNSNSNAESSENGNTTALFPNLRPRFLPLQGGLSNGCAPQENGQPGAKASARSLRCLSYGDEEVELTYMEQLVEIGQARALCDILQLLGDEYGSNVAGSKKPKKELLVKKIKNAAAAQNNGANGNANGNSTSSSSDSVNLKVVLNVLEDLLSSHEGSGLDPLSRFNDPTGFYALPRKLEIACAINRLRTVKIE